MTERFMRNMMEGMDAAMRMTYEALARYSDDKRLTGIQAERKARAYKCAQHDVAYQMLRKKYSLTDILMATGLSEMDIRALVTEHLLRIVHRIKGGQVVLVLKKNMPVQKKKAQWR